MKKNVLLFCITALASFPLCAQWSTGGTLISNTPDEHHRAFTSAAPNGSYYVCWQATDTTASSLSKIRIDHYDSTGTLVLGWPAGGKLTSPTGDHYAPQLITTEDGGVIVSWYGYASSNNFSQIYAQKYSSSGVALWNLSNPVQVSTGTIYNHKYPLLTNDKHNGAYITWVRYDSTNSASSPDIYLQHIDSLGHVATGWNANATGVATGNGQREYDPHLALTPDQSSVYVVYAQGLIGNTFLTLKKYNASNGVLATGWTAGGLTLSPGPNVYPEINHDLWIYSDMFNNATVLWIESRSSANGELYMQQVDPSANILLPPTGVLIAGNTANGIDYLQVQQESDMDLLVAFNNLETFNDVETMKVKPDGTILWHDVANTTGGYSAYPMAVSDGKKGMYVFYVNTNSPNTLHAIGLDSMGVMYTGTNWALPGPSFGNINNYDGFNPNYDLNPCATQTGEAVVAWNRRNTSNLYQIFTCNIQSNGTTCTNHPAGIEEFSAFHKILVYPNPFQDNLVIRINTAVKNSASLPILRLYDSKGSYVMEKTLNAQGETLLSTEGLSTGMYFYQVLQDGEFVQSGKVVKE